MIRHKKIEDILQHGNVGSEITVYGWVRTSRVSKNVAFAAVNDGSCFNNLQVVFDREYFPDDVLAGLLTGACVRITGELAESPGEGQAKELHAREVDFGEAREHQADQDP